jgi:hypothetical protein
MVDRAMVRPANGKRRSARNLSRSFPSYSKYLAKIDAIALFACKRNQFEGVGPLKAGTDRAARESEMHADGVLPRATRFETGAASTAWFSDWNGIPTPIVASAGESTPSESTCQVSRVDPVPFVPLYRPRTQIVERR